MAKKDEQFPRDFYLYFTPTGGGKEAPAGVNVFLRGRKTHRMRRRDRLLIFMHFANGALPSKEQKKLLARLANHYFATPGSVTSALKELASALNIYLLKRNRQANSLQEKTIATLAMAVWRGENLYLALSGPMHALLFGKEQRHFHDQSAGNGLGLGRSTPLYFASAQWQNGDALLLTPASPPQIEGQPDLAEIAKAVMADVGAAAVLVTTGTGKGELHIAPIQKALEEKAPRAKPTTPSATTPKMPPAAHPQPQETPRQAQPKPQTALPTAEAAPPTHPAEPPELKAEPSPKPPKAKHRLRLPSLAPLAEPARKAGRAIWGAGENIGAALGRISAAMLPSEDLFALPRSLMALMAVAVPLIIVTMAVIVYLRRGRMEQYQAHFARAQAEAAKAFALKEPVARHNAIQTALADLDIAESYLQTKQSRALRERLEKALDELDGIRRLNFVPALSRRAPPGTVITRLILQGGDMYALDSASGKVLHFQQEGALYRPDDDFRCGAGSYGSITVSKLVDIAPLPLSEDGPRIVGIDSRGNYVLCAPNRNAIGHPLPQPTPRTWKNPKAIAYVGGKLYVLDPAIRTIAIIGNAPTFNSTPYSYFTGATPPAVSNAIDFAVARGNLYMLLKTGEVTFCQRTPALEKTECKPLKFHDPRPGRSDGPVIPDARFAQIAMQPPPDPSLLLLDPQTQAVYQFSLQLRFVTQYRPSTPLEHRAPATAFAVDPDTHVLFIAVGSQIYQAPIE